MNKLSRSYLINKNIVIAKEPKATEAIPSAEICDCFVPVNLLIDQDQSCEIRQFHRTLRARNDSVHEISSKKNVKTLHGQSVLEYLLLVGIIVVVLFSMMQQIKRGSQSLLKVAADELGNQQNSDQTFDNKQGYLEYSNMIGTFESQKQMTDRVGVINYILEDKQSVILDEKTNLGFTEESR